MERPDRNHALACVWHSTSSSELKVRAVELRMPPEVGSGAGEHGRSPYLMIRDHTTMFRTSQVLRAAIRASWVGRFQ